ncbi:NAD(P)/FAD-dependent oxidoreductase [uncultured Maricaulis sp.]|uniref:NAD(P)/FAD-dependent oxidoreductase n=1 Tax=uncultured Maricaulis sp. TaxID=174710 RepID=UPI0030DC9174|tara:strand:- start:4750 stop:6075 length:1326 start_codon:yes stop_codon:yes gene_type:complete
MAKPPEKLVVIGAGPMGLATAYHALKRGYAVEVIEADDRPGGMAAHFDFDGLSIERFYHFCCLSDVDTLELLDELGMPDAMKWVSTKMGYYLDGRLIRWGDPVSLLMAPGIDLITKIRYGLQMFVSTKRSDWERLDKISAKDWFIGWSGEKAYDRLWRRLLELKFYELSDEVSAAWIWQRIKRLGNSRKSLFEERLGYIEGGTETLMNALAAAIEAGGGTIHYNVRAEHVLIEGDAVRGVELADGRVFEAPNVISTVPMPYVPGLLSQCDPAMRAPYEKLKNIGVVCVLHKLRRAVTDNFWVNVSDPDMQIPGFVEFSNLRPTGDDHVVYVPYYMPQTNAKFGRPDEEFIQESFAYLRTVNPQLKDSDRVASFVARLRYAQPVCETGFADLIPDFITPIAGLQIADTCFYYPEDRGVSESARFAKIMVNSMEKARQGQGTV